MLVFDEQMFDADAAKWWTEFALMDRAEFEKRAADLVRPQGAGHAPPGRGGGRRDGVADAPYAFLSDGSAPICCIREKRFATPQCSVILPSCTRMASTVSK
jgi:hypothetical protein